MVFLKRVANPLHGPALQHLRADKAGRSWAFWEEAGHGSDQAMALPFAPGHLIGKRGQEEGGERLEAVEKDAVFSFTEWWPVCFGELYKGAGRRGERRLGPSMRLFLLK